MQEIKCEQVAQLDASGFTEMTGRVYSKDGLSPSVRTFSGGNTEVKILVPLALDEQNGYLRNDGTVGTITTDGSSPKHNNRIVEPIIYDDFNGRVKADQDTIGTITTNIGNDAPRNGTKLIEPMPPKVVGGIGEKKSNGGTQYYQQDRVYEGDGIAMCHPAAIPGGSYNYQMQDYRVRKLTEKECFRLQGVKDEDFARVRKHQSKSSCYHLAGDSITVSVLMALFGEMLDIDWKSKVDGLVEGLCNG